MWKSREAEAAKQQEVRIKRDLDALTYDSETARLLLPIVIEERTVRLSGMDSLDQKAGILLAANAVLIGFAGTIDQLWGRIALVAVFLISAGLALKALRVARVPMLGSVTMLKRYIESDANGALERILTTLVVDSRRYGPVLHSKACAVKYAYLCTGLGVVLLSALVIFFGGAPL